MAYVPTLWEDGITPVDAANMNKIEDELAALSTGGGGASLTYEGDYVPATEYQDGDTVVADGIVWLCVGGPTTTPPDPTLWGSLSPGGAGGGIPADVVVPDGNFLLRNRYAEADANASYQLNANGFQMWGQGAASAVDTVLYRHAPGYLRTGGGFVVDGELYVAYGGTPSAKIWFGPSDTNLYRSAAGTLKTDGQFTAGQYVTAWAGTANQVLLGFVQGAAGAGIAFGAVGDANLYRSAAGTLKTDGTLHAVANIFATANGSYVGIGALGPAGEPGAQFTADTRLYRSAVNQLRTDGGLIVGSSLLALGGLYFGAAADATISYGAAGYLNTSGIWAGGDVVSIGPAPHRIALNSADSGIYFGNDYDTSIRRSAAGVLTTGGTLEVGVGVKYPNGSVQTRHGSINMGDAYDANALLTTGVYCVGGPLNGPPMTPATYWNIIEVLEGFGPGRSDYLVQRAYPMQANGNSWERRRDNNLWSPWVRLGGPGYQKGSFYGGAVATPVTYEYPFSANPHVFVAAADALDNAHYFSLTYPSPLTGFTVQIIGPAINATINWIAYGPF